MLDFELLQALDNHLKQQLQTPPITGTVNLKIDNQLCGYIHPDAISIVLKHPHTQFKDNTVYIFSPHSSKHALNALLRDIAEALNKAKLIYDWRNEALNVFTFNQLDKAKAQLERGAFRPLGLLTQAVHLNAWTDDKKKLFLQQRASHKAIDPNKWDILVGGLLSASESPDEGLFRESQEEVGLSPYNMINRTELKSIYRVRRQLPEGYQLEDILVSECLIKSSTKLLNQDGEVTNIKSFYPEEILAMICNNSLTLEASLILTQALLALK